METEEVLPARSFGLEICYNPSSVWHLSECNDACVLRDYTGQAMCFRISESICQNATQGYIRRACGLHRELL